MSAGMICELIGDPATSTSESLAFIRALDFQDRARVAEVVPQLVTKLGGPAEKCQVILPELVMHLDPAGAADPELSKRIDEAAGLVPGTQKFIDIVQRFGLKERQDDLVTLAAAEGTSEQLAAAAAGAAVDAGREDLVNAVLDGADPVAASRLLNALGIRGTGKTTMLLKGILADAKSSPELKSAAVRALARSQQGAKDLVAMAKAGELSGVLPQVAAVVIASCPSGDIRQSAADVLPMPKAKGGEKLPPVAKLMKRKGNPLVGNPLVGKAVFAGAGTCAKCHVVNGEGKSVGPNLSGVGAKLSREALYESVLAPSAAISHSYETFTALMEDGRSVTGLLVSQSPEQVVIRGVDSIDVTLPAGEVEELVKQPVSLMPADLATTLSADELVDVVAWMETLRVTQ